MIRVLMADDHPIFRHGVRQILAESGDIEFAGEAVDCADALAQIRAHPWDVVLLDLSMPGRGGIEVLQEARKEFPALPVLVLSMHSEEQFAVRALRAGAAGYLTKDSAPAALVGALRKVAAGGRYISAPLAERLVATVLRAADQPLHETLSDREFQVFRGLAAGRSVGALADALALSVKTVSTYRARVLEKMTMTSNAEVIHYAIRHQLVE
jgi:two-component system, NarL family, invasion response regulator UvrY